MTSMRTLLDLIEPHSESHIEHFFAFSQSRSLTEARQSLSEAAIGDRINAVTKRVHDQYGDIQAAFLAKATMKAMDAFSKGKNADPKVTAALGKVLKISKFAVQNRALLSVLLGIVSTLIGIAVHPTTAGAGEVSQIDMLLQGKGLDEIIDKLHHSGIDVGSVDANMVPTGVSEIAAKAAKALVAIERYKYVHGADVSSSRELVQSVSLVGTVDKAQSQYHEVINLMTGDGKVTLARIDTVVTDHGDGNLIDDPSETGVEFQLGQYVRGKSVAETNAAQDYLEQALDKEHSTERVASGMQEATSGIFQRIRGLITKKSSDLGVLVAAAVADKPDGRYEVRIGPNGISIKPVTG